MNYKETNKTDYVLSLNRDMVNAILLNHVLAIAPEDVKKGYRYSVSFNSKFDAEIFRTKESI